MITPQTPIRARLVGAALALSFAVGSQLSASAHAGSLAVFSCELPGGAPAPTEGWTSGWTAGTLPDAGSADSCTSPDGALSSFVGDQVSQPGSDGPFWEYTPPSGFTVVGGQLTAGFDIPGASATGYSAAAGMLGPQFQFDPADVIGGLPGGEWGSVESTWSLSGHTGGHIWLYSFCEPYGARCPAGGSTTSYWSTDELKQGIIVLSNNTSPTGSSFAGALTGPGAQTGTRNLVFQAADSGSGVYKVQVQLSGATLYSATPDTDAGRCVPDGSYGSSLEFTSASPCPRSATANTN